MVKTSGSPPACGQLERLWDRHGGALVHHGELGLAAAAHDRHHPVALLEAARHPDRAPTTSPASSMPGMSAGEPGGAG